MGVLAFVTLAQLNFSSNTLAANNETELVKVALISETLSAPKKGGFYGLGYTKNSNPIGIRIGVMPVILACQPN